MTSTHIATTSSALRYPYRIALPGTAEYHQLSNLIEKVFIRAYQAQVSVTYTQLLGVYGAGEEPQAALGMRGASEQSLFLEHYLDQPAERAVYTHTGLRFDRSKIAEAGNLASTRMLALRDLMLALSVQLKLEGFEYILFTGTESLKRYLELLGLKPVVYADADPSRLPGGGAAWGSYYATGPKVMGGTVDELYYGLLAAYGKRGDI